jgi:integrase
VPFFFAIARAVSPAQQTAQHVSLGAGIGTLGWPSMKEPWFRKSDGWWYIEVHEGGKRRFRRLAKSKSKAFDQWHELERIKPADAPDAQLVTIFDRFLGWCEANQPASTFSWYERYLKSFAKFQADGLDVPMCLVEVRNLKPHHLTAWITAGRLSQGAKRAAITSVKRALNWAVGEGLLTTNPIASVKRPKSGRRKQLVATTSAREMAEATDPPFRLFLLALRLSGCRPKEVSTVTAANVDLDAEAWLDIHNKTGAKTGLERNVYVGNACLLTLTKILAHYRPEGALFRNAEGKPWTTNAIRCRMRRIRSKLGLPAGTVAYSFRHSYITEAMQRGVDVATVAELTGTSVAMIQRHYGHLGQKGEHLRQAARRASNPSCTSASLVPADPGATASDHPQIRLAQDTEPDNAQRATA